MLRRLNEEKDSLAKYAQFVSTGDVKDVTYGEDRWHYVDSVSVNRILPKILKIIDKESRRIDAQIEIRNATDKLEYVSKKLEK